jgi:hypothetical protein
MACPVRKALMRTSAALGPILDPTCRESNLAPFPPLSMRREVGSESAPDFAGRLCSRDRSDNGFSDRGPGINTNSSGQAKRLRTMRVGPGGESQ